MGYWGSRLHSVSPHGFIARIALTRWCWTPDEPVGDPRCRCMCQVAWSLVRRGYQHMVVHVTTRLIAEGEYEVVAAMAEELYASGTDWG